MAAIKTSLLASVISRLTCLGECSPSCPSQVKRIMTDNSKDVVIASISKRIKALEEENKRLKAELMHLRGKLYNV